MNSMHNLAMDSVGKKTGLDNPKGYCFLNSVIQVLRGCKIFNDAVLKYHENSGIEKTEEKDEGKVIFVIHFCTLLHKLKNNENVDEQLKGIQNYFISSSTGDDVYKCFMNLLSIINDVIKNPNLQTSENPEDKANSNSKIHANKNHGFVYECFCGRLLFTMIRESCNAKINEKSQFFKCLPLPVPETDETIQLLDCIKLFLEKTKVEMDDDFVKYKCQNENNISLKCQIIHCPQYLFIYLDRGSLILEGVKKNTFIKCSETISIEIVNEKVEYRLISVIDHLGTNENGHYFCKCNYEEDTWWLLNDSQVEPMDICNIDKIVTKDTIAFMFKKQISLLE